MKIALIGASGRVGRHILAEALERGHQVTAIVRRPERVSSHPNLTTVKGDALNMAELAPQLKGHDAVISAFSPGLGHPDLYQQMVDGAHAIIQATKQAGVPRLLVVGGAASLEVAPGVELIDTPDFPGEWKDAALGTRAFLVQLRFESDALDWTFLSPAMLLDEGPRLGQFRLGTDQVLFNAKGESHISLADYAVAMINELEQHKHPRQRFTVAY